MSEAFLKYESYCKPKLAELLRSLKLDKEFVRAEGAVLRTREGEDVIDFIGGFGATLLGHNHPEIREEAVAFLTNCLPVHAQVSVRTRSGELAERLNELVPGTPGYRINFSNSGTEGVEAALKHAYKVRFDAVRIEYERLTRILNDFYYRYETEKLDLALPGKKTLVDFRDDLDEYNLSQFEAFQKEPVVLAFKGSFHGKTASSLKVTFNKSYREGYEGLSAIKTRFIDMAGPGRIPELAEEEVCRFYYPALVNGEVELRPIVMTKVIALLFEPILGEGGIKPLPEATTRFLAERHQAMGIPYIIDEIQAGCGRTGSIFSYGDTPLRNIAPEYIVMSKSLGGGVAKIGATFIRKDIYDQDFGILHTSTFGEDDFSSAIALRFLDILTRDGGAVLAEVVRKGEYLRAGLEALRAEFPALVRDVRGRGLMMGVELTDLSDRSPFFRASGKQGILSILIASYLLEHHNIRILAPLTTMLKGNPGKNRLSILRIQPPVCIRERDIDALLSGLREVFRIIQNNNEYCLIAHLSGHPLSEEDRREPRAFPSIWPVVDEPRHIDARTGFVVHPTNMENLIEYYFPSFEAYGTDKARLRAWWNLISRFLEPIQVKKDFVSSNDFVLENNLIFVPYLPEGMVGDHPPHIVKEVRDKIQDAVIVAKELGDDNIPVNMVGLGAYTSIATNNGLTLNDYEMCVTTGNAYTTALTVEGILKAVEAKGSSMEESWAAVVGAAGNIGQVVAQLLSLYAGTLELVGSGKTGSLKRLQAVRRECLREILKRLAAAGAGQPDLEENGYPVIDAESLGPIPAEILGELRDGTSARAESLREVFRRLAADPGQAIPPGLFESMCEGWAPGEGLGRILLTPTLGDLMEADVVVLATNSDQGDLITPDRVRPGAVVCCTSVPTNLSRDFAGSGVLAFDGGLAQLPEDSEIRFVGMPKHGMAYGCLSETLLMGFEGFNHSFCKGVLTTEKVFRTMEMADMFGFRLGALKFEEQIVVAD